MSVVSTASTIALHRHHLAAWGCTYVHPYIAERMTPCAASALRSAALAAWSQRSDADHKMGLAFDAIADCAPDVWKTVWAPGGHDAALVFEMMGSDHLCDRLTPLLSCARWHWDAYDAINAVAAHRDALRVYASTEATWPRALHTLARIPKQHWAPRRGVAA